MVLSHGVCVYYVCKSFSVGVINYYVLLYIFRMISCFCCFFFALHFIFLKNRPYVWRTIKKKSFCPRQDFHRRLPRITPCCPVYYLLTFFRPLISIHQPLNVTQIYYPVVILMNQICPMFSLQNIPFLGYRINIA